MPVSKHNSTKQCNVTLNFPGDHTHTQTIWHVSSTKTRFVDKSRTTLRMTLQCEPIFTPRRVLANYTKMKDNGRVSVFWSHLVFQHILLNIHGKSPTCLFITKWIHGVLVHNSASRLCLAFSFVSLSCDQSGCWNIRCAVCSLHFTTGRKSKLLWTYDWSYGWMYEFMESWSYAFLNLCVCEFMDIWIYGSMNLWHEWMAWDVGELYCAMYPFSIRTEEHKFILPENKNKRQLWTWHFSVYEQWRGWRFKNRKAPRLASYTIYSRDCDKASGKHSSRNDYEQRVHRILCLISWINLANVL